jgi:hypothetical protein
MLQLDNTRIIRPQELFRNPAESDQTIYELLGLGIATTVEKQDWLVDRDAPPFIEASELIRFVNNAGGEPKVMHLGMGDGSANEQFKRFAKDHKSVCIADKIYIDPRDIIDAFLVNALNAELAVVVPDPSIN